MIMKHTITYTLALLTVFSASVAWATDITTTCQVVSEDDMLYRLVYQGSGEKNVTIQLLDDQQRLVYKEQLWTSAFNKQFDLTNLPYGDYHIEVKSGDYYFSEKVKLGDLSDFQFKMDQRESRKVALVGSKTAGKNMTLYILDDDQDVVYREQFDQLDQVHKSFNFQDLRSEGVTFLLYHDDRLITEENFVF